MAIDSFFQKHFLASSFFSFSALLHGSFFQAARADSGGLQTSIAVDIVGNALARDREFAPSKLAVREAELFFFAPIDAHFDGVLGVAAHQEDGSALFEIHEATIGSAKLIPWSRFRVGQYFLAIGKLNAVHRHDWPFTSAPKVHREFFGNEGVDDTGIEYSILPPLPVYLDLTLGLTSGWKFGHVHSAGKEPQVPTHYARLATFTDLAWGGGLQTGLSYLGRTDASDTQTTFIGFDLTAKWREGKNLPFFLQAELWHRAIDPKLGLTGASGGFYVFPQVNLFEGTHFGLRYDAYTIFTLENARGRKVENHAQSFVPTLTWKPSEFSTLRASYQWDFERTDAKSGLKNSFLELQTTFILGAHPAHDF